MDTAFNGHSRSSQKNHHLENENQGSFLVHNVIQPLLSLISRIIACYDQVYRPTEKINDEMSWAIMNFLNKIGDFHRAFE